MLRDDVHQHHNAVTVHLCSQDDLEPSSYGIINVCIREAWRDENPLIIP